MTHLVKPGSIWITGLACLLLAGCAAAPVSVTMTDASLRSGLAYTPIPAAVQVPVGVSIESMHTLSPEVRQVWTEMRLTEQSQAAYSRIFAEILRDDLTYSGLFSRVVPPGWTEADFAVRIVGEDLNLPAEGFTTQITVTAVARGGGKEITRSRQKSWGHNPHDAKPQVEVPIMMKQLKDELAAALLERTSREAETLQNASLRDLLQSGPESLSATRERNRAIIAAKNRELASLLRDSPTSDLQGLVVRLEQLILDLNHESELLKDRAQEAAANQGDVATLRSLAISYRERIELIKPILAATKDEIVQRDR